MDDTLLTLRPVSVPEWEAEDLVRGVLGPAVTMATDEQAEAMLKEIRVKLPQDILREDLATYAGPQKASFQIPDGVETTNYDFYVIQVPLNILVPEGRITRLRLRLQLVTAGVGGAVAYDLFPPDKWDVSTVKVGDVKLDVSKALGFVCPAAADCLGLNLGFPIQWTVYNTRIETTDRMSNPVEWYVTDRSVEHGFSGAVIARVPKGADLSVEAAMVGEIRKSGPLGRLLKARFASDTRIYPVKVRP
ncbi:MAG: hypothetical protein ABSF25_00930 [Bryobacteraceae bacterium]|jgi:hypothetical protein